MNGNEDVSVLNTLITTTSTVPLGLKSRLSKSSRVASQASFNGTRSSIGSIS